MQLRIFTFKNKEAFYFSDFIHLIDIPRGTCSYFLRNKRIKSIGKHGHRSVIAIEDLQKFLCSKYYFEYLEKRPSCKKFNLSNIELININIFQKEKSTENSTEKKEKSDLPFCGLNIEELQVQFFNGDVEKKIRVTARITKDLSTKDELDSLLTNLINKGAS